MKAIFYISSFSKGLTRLMIDDMILTINRNNRTRRVTGILIIRNKHFFQK
ncbi:BLUF domain-containing protein [Winogradskyella poriferorum]